MAGKKESTQYKRREFFKKVAAGGALAASGAMTRAGQESPASLKTTGGQAIEKARPRIAFPRVFTGPNLRMIAFPLGGLGTGTVSLGGRGQLRDWEIFNRPDKGNAPDYGFASIWASLNGRKPVARVLEARIDTPYEGESGLGSKNVPGLPRLAGATFTGAYPFAQIDFEDAKLPVKVSLEAFNPLVPLDTEASGFPVAVLRYKVRNPNAAPAKVGIAFSLQNMVGKEGRQSAFREGEGISGLFMSNPMIAETDPLAGTMFLGALGAPPGSGTYLKGWKRATWWDGPLTFWDEFAADGALTQDAPALSPVGSAAVTQTIAPKAEATFTFLIAWHFPNRTPERCDWPAPEGQEKKVIGNHYCQRFNDAWDAATQLARELPTLEARTRKFAGVVKSCNLPSAALEAAVSNLSILRTNTAFRTADGEFHGFEGCNDKHGCCHGSCTHVWNYEHATAYFFPTMARSLRESEFLRNTQENGLMGFRSYLPDGLKIWEKAAADGQMGCLIKLYRDWQLLGDTDWLKKFWPSAKRALEFAWINGGWDADRDGVMEGVQHNTYDVEFYGPNPLAGIYYLGALRAGEDMARAVGDKASADEYRRLFETGRKWIDANLFNGEYYIQKVVGRKNEEIAAGLRVGMGGADNMNPDYQMGEACLVDQLLGQYMAHVAGLGYLLDKEHVRKTLRSIFRYNYHVDLSEHETVQRTFAVNEDGGVLIASYPSGKRPAIPFPYFAEVMSGFEYQFAAHLIYEGMLDEALTVVETIRRRHDGERRNPWNEPECGHHYARAMASWAVILALNGFHYAGPAKELTLIPRMRGSSLKSFWTLPSGWGGFEHATSSASQRAVIMAAEGRLALSSLVLDAKGKARVAAKLGNDFIPSKATKEGNRIRIQFAGELEVAPERALTVTLRA
jgi:non-lysosomal glucosylceramidase